MTFTSAMQKMQFEGLVEFIEKHNALVAQINAATGDRESLAESIRESDEFSDIREQIARLQDQLDAAVNEKVEQALANASGDTEALTEQVKELKSLIRDGSGYYAKLYGKEAAEALPKVDRVKGQRTGGGGGGGRRVRGYNVVVTIGEEVTEYDNFAGAAKALGLETAQLQEAFFAKAGVEKLKDAPDEVSFNMSWEDVDSEGNKIARTGNVRAYRTGPSGPPTSEDASSDEVTEPLDEDALAEA